MSLLLFKGDDRIINLTLLFLEKREEAILFKDFNRSEYHFEITTNEDEGMSDLIVNNSRLHHTSVFVMPTKDLRYLVHEATFLVDSRGYPIERALLIELRKIYGNEINELIRGE